MLVLSVLQGPDQGKKFQLPDNEPQMIGRSSESLKLGDNTISRRHCELTPDDGAWWLRDLDSANGTFVNGQQVFERYKLQLGDQIRFGMTLMLYGKESRTESLGVQLVRHDEISTDVQHTVSSPDDTMDMALAEPGEAAILQLKVIYELTALIGAVTKQTELLEKIMDVIFKNFKADRAFVLLKKGDDDLPTPVVIRHRVKPSSQQAGQIKVSRTIIQHVMHHKEGVLSSNAMTDARFNAGDSVREYGMRSALCVPIKYKDEMFGVIHLDSKMADYTFSEDQLRLLTAIGVQTGLAMSNVQLYGAQLKAERLAAVGQTVASLSHSIRNILQGLRGGADVVELGIKKGKTDVIINGWQIVSRNLDRIMGLTLNMLAYSKQRQPELEMTNLEHLIKEIEQLVTHQYDQKEVALFVEIEPDMPPIPLDPGGIHQVILNLLNNALDATRPGTGIVTLRANYIPDSNLVEIHVADNGMGMDHQVRDRLFEPFYSTKGYQGTGLGLVVTKKLVEEHDGTLTVESTLKKGTTFTIRLPTERTASGPADTSVSISSAYDQMDVSDPAD